MRKTKTRVFIIFLLLLFTHTSKSKSSGEDTNLKSIYNLKASWISQNNEKIKLSQFAGENVLIAMAYTSCQATCPIIIKKMQDIQMASARTKKMKVIVVTFDPLRDTPNMLKKFSKKMKLDDNWYLLSGADSGIRDLANALNVKYIKDASGEFAHSNIITLLDSQGGIKTQLRSLSEDSKPLLDLIN